MAISQKAPNLRVKKVAEIYYLISVLEEFRPCLNVYFHQEDLSLLGKCDCYLDASIFVSIAITVYFSH